MKSLQSLEYDTEMLLVLLWGRGCYENIVQESEHEVEVRESPMDITLERLTGVPQSKCHDEELEQAKRSDYSGL